MTTMKTSNIDQILSPCARWQALLEREWAIFKDGGTSRKRAMLDRQLAAKMRSKLYGDLTSWGRRRSELVKPPWSPCARDRFRCRRPRAA
jgi:hypothetical protein